MHQEIFSTYLYCFCKEKIIPPSMGFERRLELLPVGNFYAVIESVSEKDFSEEKLQTDVSNMEWLLGKVNTHERIVQNLMEATTVLPIKFATIFSSETNIITLFNENLNTYKSNFQKLENRQEWRIKVYCSTDEEWLLLRTQDKEIQKAIEDMESASPGKEFLMKKKILGLVKRKKLELYKSLGSELYHLFQKNTAESLQKSVLPDSTDKKLILNSVFLIDKSQVKIWLESLHEIENWIDNDKLELDVTGPCPPYHFVN